MTDNNSSMTDNQPPSNNPESTTHEEEGASLGGTRTAASTAATTAAMTDSTTTGGGGGGVGMGQKMEAAKKKGKMDNALEHGLASIQDIEDSILKKDNPQHKCTTTKMGPSPDAASSQGAIIQARQQEILEDGKSSVAVAVDGVKNPETNNDDNGTLGEALADPNAAAPRPGREDEENDVEFANALRISEQASRAGAFHVLGMDRAARVLMQGTLEHPEDMEEEAEEAATIPAQNQNPPTIFHATIVPDRGNNTRRTASATNNNSSSNANHSGAQDVVDPTLVVHAVKEDEGDARGGGGGDLSRRGMMGAMMGIFILVVIIILLVLGLSGVLGSSTTSTSSQDSSGATTTRPNLRPSTLPPSSSSSSDLSGNDIASTIAPTSSGNLSFWSPTLERIQKEGVVRFGHTGYLPGLLYLNQEGVMSGFFVDIVRTVQYYVCVSDILGLLVDVSHSRLLFPFFLVTDAATACTPVLCCSYFF